jgi:aminopeptidase N/puromycin-sensitive aminopeptidase
MIRISFLHKRSALCLLFAIALLAPTVSLRAQRLPQTVLPVAYTLALTPDLKAATFSGVESIEVNVQQAVSTITLNAAEIAFQSVSIQPYGKPLKNGILDYASEQATVSLDPVKEQATFTFHKPIPAGKAVLSIAYTGILNNELRGFYLSKTERRNYAVTQFESTDARRAYPCFDEPAMKATYDVSLTIDAVDTAISNSPVVSDTPGLLPAKHTLRFAPTPKMSTYLVAFLVGDFECTKGESDGVAIRVCSTPDKVQLTHFGLEVAEKVLHYYNGYFGIPYPLKKLDLIALPDFEAGAMENFGAITYRETDLLIDDKTASVGARERVAIVVAHEMAHQWFGDLVTMQWWDNLWLNEGFATWMETKAVAHLYPEFNIEEGIVADADGTLNLDAQPTTRSIRAKADTPDEINQMFDGIAYGKAGAVLQSVENYLGEETFRQGVHNYLAAHQYGNATAEDFWGAQTANSHKPVDKIMESLVVQPGEPLLTFGTPVDGKVAVSQQRFFLTPSVNSSNQPNPAQRWTLPVCFKTDKGQDCQVLTPADSTLKAPAASTFFADAGGNGYYRSAYAPATYKTLVAGVETALAPTERIRLIGNQWAQLRANKASLGDYMDMVAAVRADQSPDVLRTTFEGISTIYSRVAANPAEKFALAAWIRANFSPTYSGLPAPSASDSARTRELRAELFGFLGTYGKDPAILAQARSLAQQYLADPSSVDATLAQPALAIAARNGDQALFDQLQTVYETSKNPEIQETALHLLALFQDPALASRALNYAVSSKVRNQDADSIFNAELGNEVTRDLAWKFIQNNWDKVRAQLTTATGGYLVSATGAFCSAEARDQIKSFFVSHPVPSSDRSLRHAFEHINGCIELRSLEEPSLQQWLAAQPK